MTRVKEMVQHMFATSNIDPKQYASSGALELLKAEVACLTASNNNLVAENLILNDRIKDLTSKLESETKQLTTKAGNVGEDVIIAKKGVTDNAANLITQSSLISNHSAQITKFTKWMEHHKILETDITELKKLINETSSLSIATKSLMNSTNSKVTKAEEDMNKRIIPIETCCNKLMEVVQGLSGEEFNFLDDHNSVQSPQRKVAKKSRPELTTKKITKNLNNEFDKEGLSLSDDEMDIGQSSDTKQ